MIICDICQAIATDQIVFKKTDEKFDLCESHSQLVRELITSKEKAEPEKIEPEKRRGPGRPPK